MHVSRRYLVFASIAVTVATIFLAASYSESKVSQCRKFIKIVNRGNSLLDRNKARDAVNLNQLATDLAEVGQTLADLKLTDRELVGFQNHFVIAFKNLSQAIAKANLALNSASKAEMTSNGRAKVESARKEIEAGGRAAMQAAAQTETLTKEINQYCWKN
jgi:hypothetical protein